MAILSPAKLDEVFHRFMSDVSSERIVIGLDKNELRDAFEKADFHLDVTSNARNTTLPPPARTRLSKALKERIYRDVTQKRFAEGL